MTGHLDDNKEVEGVIQIVVSKLFGLRETPSDIFYE